MTFSRKEREKMLGLDGCVASDLWVVNKATDDNGSDFHAPWELVVSVACAYSPGDGFRD